MALGVVLALIAGTSAWTHRHFWTNDLVGQDIYYAWLDGSRLVHADNPYSRIKAGNMRENEKYATYLPAFYLGVAATNVMGVTSFMSWVPLWRTVVLLTHFAIGILIYLVLYNERLPILALLGTAFWMLNRWTIVVIEIAHLDFLPVFLLLSSLVLFARRKTTLSLLTYSMSLAIKHVAVFLFPVFLIWVWKSAGRRSVRPVLKAAALAASIPLLTSLPFLIWDAEGFLRSIVFSLTRDADSHMTSSMDVYLGLHSLAARLPMIGLMCLAYVAIWKRNFGVYVPALLILLVFTSFNPVLFWQYMCWTIPFVPLAIGSLLSDASDARLSV